MAEIPQGALEADFPTFVKEKKSTGTIEFQGRQVELFNFSFLGVDIAGGGVNKDLAERLINAQTALYSLAFQDRMDQLAKEGKPAPAELTKDEFKAWCWLGQEPSNGGAPQIRQHGGFQDRGNPSSKHSSGSAIDINYEACPWTPVRDANGVHGGELHKTKDPNEDPKKRIFLFKGDFRALHTDKVWKPAFVIFDRANALFQGKPADLRPELDRGKADDMYHRFRAFSYNLQTYFRYAFHPANSGRKPLQKPFEEFKAALETDLSTGLIHDNAVHVDGTPLKPALKGPNPDATFQAFYDKIVEDHAFMPKVITVGKLTVDANGDITGPGGRQRDPCNGVFNMRKEVFMEMVVKQKLRWGGAMFGTDSGDTMHFDLDGHFIDGKKVTV
ncbi:MAG TPA: hypothetical protein VJ385_19750 [Fibrobacteria bacterium]|nr:hypothetical protein [Fibrobacteria bacterium]